MVGTEEDDPTDDVTHWIGKIPKESTNEPERTDQRTTRRSEQSDVQRKKPPVAERG